MDNHFSNPFVDDVPDWSADFNTAVTPTNSNIASAADATDGKDSELHRKTHHKPIQKQHDAFSVPSGPSTALHSSLFPTHSVSTPPDIMNHTMEGSAASHIQSTIYSGTLAATNPSRARMFIPGPASAPLDRTNTHPRLPLSADPAFGSVYSKADVNAFLAEMLPSETVSGAEATTHLITSDLDGYESDSMELMGHRDDPHLLSMNTFNSETANSTPSAHHDLSARIQPHMDSGSSSEIIRHRASSRRRKRSDLFNLPEKEFLQYILLEQDAQLVHELLSQRLSYLSSNDFAEKMHQMPAWKVAFRRCPAILATLGLELIVGAVISSRHELIRANMMITSFLPVLSSIAGNVGLQASTATLRGLSTGHASGSNISGVTHILLKEFYASLVVASVASIALTVISSNWAHAFNFGFATGLAAISGIMGALGPLTFRALKIDPALMAGPFETAMQDLIGSSVYLGLCAAILS
ncbi:hypothetical protein BSLG_002527 [Batrachochytrium salamandrivorans]|nr:hypothetical protein BSLG_002527 [Batrachochytrium salamandrivorans]